MIGTESWLGRRRFLQMSALAAGAALLAPEMALAEDPVGPGNYGFGAPPPIGVHPRVVLNPTELDHLRTRIQSGIAQQNFTTLENAAKRLPTYDLLVRLGKGEKLSATNQETLAKEIAGAALVAMVRQDPTIVDTAKAALLMWVRKIVPETNDDFSRTVMHPALAYDWLFNVLSESERVEVREWIARRLVVFEAILDTVVHGFLPGAEEQRNYNWVPHVLGAFGPAALAIEGEAGYQDRWYSKSVSSIHDFMDYGIGPEGAPLELLHYFAYGMWQGAFFVDAMARRGDKVLQHPHLKKVPLWWTADMLPWGRDWNSMQDTRDVFHGVPPAYYLLRLAYPDNPVMRWVYTNFINAALQYPDSIAAVLWASDIEPADAALTAGQLDLNPSQLFLHNGLAYLRDGWGPDDTYFEFQSDAALFGPTHGHADRNSFTLMGKSRIWVMDAGGFFPFDTGHNTVMIDGKGEGYFPQKGDILAYKDAGWATGIIGDAKAAYDWRCDFEPADKAGWTLVNGAWSMPYNPVQRAFRSGTMVRGSHPYVMIADDIRKDAQTRDYSWQALVPLGTKVVREDEQTLYLEPVDTGAYVVSGVTPIKVPFTISTSGSYRVWLLSGRDYTSPWNWRTNLAVDTGTAVAVSSAEDPAAGDCAQPHWVPVPLPNGGIVQLSAGAHTATISPTGPLKYVALLVTAPDFDPTGPFEATPPAGSSLVRIADLPRPSGWKLIPAEVAYPRCLVTVVNPAEASLDAEMFRRNRTDNGQNWGRTIKLRAQVNSVEPKFRVIFYPHRKGDPVPAVTADGASATVAWPDGVTDAWRFGSSSRFDGINESAVSITRGTQSFVLNVTYQSLRDLTDEYVTNKRMANGLTSILSTAEKLDRNGQDSARDKALDSYVRTVEALTDRWVTPDHARMLILQATALKR